eukprot:11625097-Heterocapsa_arctica.AAC.1
MPPGAFPIHAPRCVKSTGRSARSVGARAQLADGRELRDVGTQPCSLVTVRTVLAVREHRVVDSREQ